MTIEELQKSLQDAAEARKSEVAALEERLKKAEDNEAIKSLQKDLTDSQEAIKALNLKLKSLEEAPAAPKEIVEFLKSEEGKKAIQSMKNGTRPEDFKLKAAGAMTITDSLVPTTAGGVLASLIGANGEVYLINRLTLDSILDAVSVMSTDKADIVYVEEVAKEGAVAQTDEGDAIPLVDWTFQEKKSSATKTAGMLKVSEEALMDTAYIASVITEVMNQKYYRAKEADIVAAVLAGAVAFDNATTLYPTMAAPTVFDVINALAAQSAKKGFIPDAVLMHPVDVFALRSIKDVDGQPIVAFLNDGKTPFLNNGLRIVMHLDATKGTAIVGTFKNLQVYDYDLRLEFGFDADDFSKDLRSLRAVGRYHKILPSNKNNFVKGVVATVITALTTPVVPEG